METNRKRNPDPDSDPAVGRLEGPQRPLKRVEFSPRQRPGRHGFRADPWPRTGIRNPRAPGERRLSACGLEDSPTGRYAAGAREGLRPPETPPPDTNRKQGSRTGIGPARTERVQLDCFPGNEILRRENARGSHSDGTRQTEAREKESGRREPDSLRASLGGLGGRGPPVLYLTLRVALSGQHRASEGL